jgi:hypothetical protein
LVALLGVGCTGGPAPASPAASTGTTDPALVGAWRYGTDPAKGGVTVLRLTAEGTFNMETKTRAAVPGMPEEQTARRSGKWGRDGEELVLRYDAGHTVRYGLSATENEITLTSGEKRPTQFRYARMTAEPDVK